MKKFKLRFNNADELLQFQSLLKTRSFEYLDELLLVFIGTDDDLVIATNIYNAYVVDARFVYHKVNSDFC